MIALATTPAEAPSADELIERWATAADKVHAATRSNGRARYHSVLARAALRALLFSHTSQIEWHLQPDARGKLSAIDPMGKPGPAISVSHTRAMVACGLATAGEFGIDVEAHRPRAFRAIADWSFGEVERRAVEAGQAPAFYRIWTLREAMSKATGEGLSLVTDGHDRSAGPDDGIWQTRLDGQDWLLAHYRVGPRRDISLAAAVLVKERHLDFDVEASLRWVDLIGLRP
jgi:4'-phosphopantetheinyl transferase